MWKVRVEMHAFDRLVVEITPRPVAYGLICMCHIIFRYSFHELYHGGKNYGSNSFKPFFMFVEKVTI